jgi:membrane protease YdiL (CAAX protease family)
MLFLLKRTVSGSLLGLLVLATLGLIARQLVPAAVPVEFSFSLALTGIVIGGIVIGSDGLIHGSLWLLFGQAYLGRYEQLAGTFRRQTLAAMVCGALMAGVGEELVFRGLSSNPAVLLPAAVVFGLLHHIRRDLWPITIWSIWEGVLFTLAVLYTGSLLPNMIAHFLHDLIGFLIFRHFNRTMASSAGASAVS